MSFFKGSENAEWHLPQKAEVLFDKSKVKMQDYRYGEVNTVAEANLSKVKK